MKNIERLCKETGFSLSQGECGFGRPCLGILDRENNVWVSYAIYGKDLDFEAQHKAEPAPHAYHKGPYMAVLMEYEGVDLETATKELDDWCGRILEQGFELKEYKDSSSISCLLKGVPFIILKAIVNRAKRKILQDNGGPVLPLKKKATAKCKVVKTKRGKK